MHTFSFSVLKEEHERFKIIVCILGCSYNKLLQNLLWKIIINQVC